MRGKRVVPMTCAAALMATTALRAHPGFHLVGVEALQLFGGQDIAHEPGLYSIVQRTKVTVAQELAAVKEYDEKLKESCEAKAPSFEEREQRRKAEIEGLQTALAILDGRDIAMTQLSRGLRR